MIQKDVLEEKMEDYRQAGAAPQSEPERQYYFMARARELVADMEEKLGRKPTCCVVTFGCQMNARDSEKLLGILKEAGYEFDDNGMLSSSTPIDITYLTNDSEGHVKIGQAIQQDVAKIGINLTVETREWAVFLNERKEGKFDFAREGWLADYNDPINMLEMWETTSGNNDMQFGR